MSSIGTRLERAINRLLNRKVVLPIQLDVTNFCNLNCSHCYHPDHVNHRTLTFPQWSDVLEQYERLTEKLQIERQLLICGGEPLASLTTARLVQRVAALDEPYQVRILTNGTLVSRFDFSQFDGFRKVDFQISLDGPDLDSHESVRGSGSFQKTIEGVNLLKARGYAVHILAVLSWRSFSNIGRFFELARELNASSMNFTRFIAEGQGSLLNTSGTDRPLNPHELKEAYKTILVESVKSGIQTSTNLPLMHLLHKDLGGSGRFGEGFVVDFQGNLLASSRSRVRIGHVFKEGLEQTLFQNPLYRAIRRGAIDQCGSCRYFRNCGGDRNAAYAGGNGYLGADPGCWLSSSTNTVSC